MSRRDKIVLLVGALALAAMGAYSALNLRVSTDITHFLPSSDDRKLADISKQLTESSLTRTMILSVEAPDSERAISAGRQLADALRANPEVLRVQSGPDARFAETAFSLLFPHRYHLYSDQPEKALAAKLSDDGLAQSAEQLKQQLSLPTAALVKKIAASDPLLMFPSILKRLEAAGAGTLKIVDGQFLSADGLHAVLFLETKSSPFDGAVQMPFLAFIQDAFQKVSAAHGGTLRLEQSGLNRFAVDSERVIKDDINRISTFSTIAIVLVFLLLFRSIRVLLLSFVPLTFGVVSGITASVALFGEVHGLTLAFGATLIGVCIDFPVHFLNHHALDPHPDGARASMRRILGALVLGSVTTIAGFGGLAWTSFPGMRELAVFATVGVVAALVSTIWLLPPLSVAAPKQVALHQAFAEVMGRLLAVMQRRRTVLLALPALAAVLAAVGLPRVRWSDDLSALNRVNEEILAEDTRVRDRVSRMDSGRFIIVTAPTDAEALAINDRVYAQLEKAKGAGEVEEFRSLHSLLFSEELQKRNADAFRRSAELAPRVMTAMATSGFKAEAFNPFAESLARAESEPLKLAEVLNSPLGDLVRPFRVELDGEVGLVTLVRGVTSTDEIQARIGEIPGAHYFDQTAFMSRAYGQYRQRTLELVAVGLALMLLMIFAKYRRVRPTIAAALPAILASVATLSVLGLLGVTTNLLHLVSLLLVLSTGEDYAVFLLASAKQSKELQASAVSIVLCSLSTVLGFGLLAFSKIPALQALGATTGIGIFFCLLLAPTALALAPEGSER